MEHKQDNKPEKKFRAGGVSVTIWNNPSSAGEQQTYKTVTFERSYKDKDSAWKTTHSLRVNDLPKAQVILGKAYEYLVIGEQSA